MARGFRQDCEGFHRRDFLAVGTAGLFGLGVPPFVAFNEMRNGNPAGYLGTAYNPFIIEGGAGGKGGAGNLRVRGIQLPAGFTLDELANRDKLLQSFDETFREADRSADLVE